MNFAASQTCYYIFSIEFVHVFLFSIAKWSIKISGNPHKKWTCTYTSKPDSRHYNSTNKCFQ